MPLSKNPITLHRHVQTIPALTWTIAHGQGSYPLVDVYILNDSVVKKIIPDTVTYVDPNTVTVSFSVSRAGFATVLV